MYLILVRQGEKYSEDYVKLLKKQAKETSGLETLVLGDQNADIPLEYNWKGWWAKMELFRPDLDKPFYYVDLDSYILQDISHVQTDYRLISREWSPVAQPHHVQSSFMYLNETQDIWEEWIAKGQYEQYWGDQAFLEKFKWEFTQDKYPDLIGSYKWQNLEAPIHRIVTFHGKPNPEDCEGWAGEIWTQQTS